jgi:amino-acid N-acetyltransferase
MEIRQISQNTFSKSLELLQKNNLPTEDISGATKLFAAADNDEVVGTIGIEFYKGAALLRSLVVTEAYQGKGLGRKLVEHIENFAKENGAKELILLTTTASDYFTKRAYQTIQRNNVPEELKKSSQYTSTCPSSAITMKKSL